MTSAKDFDYLLDRYLSRGGPAQWRQYGLLLLQGVASTVPFYLHLFAAATPAHRCRVPACDANSSALDEPWVAFAVPPPSGGDDTHHGGLLRHLGNRSSCRVYQSGEAAACEAASFSANATRRCDDYVFDASVVEETLVTQLKLVCGGRRHEKFLGTVLMVGLMVGCFVGGPLGDRLGRKATLVAAAAVLAPLVAAGGFTPYYELYAVLRFFTYLCISIMWITSHALVLELFGRRMRKAAYVATSVWYCLLNLLLPLIVYLERNWTYMHLWVGVLVLSTVPVLAHSLEESVRWLAVNDRMERATERVREMARSGGVFLTEANVKDIRETLAGLADVTSRGDERRLAVWDMLRAPYLGRTAVLLCSWVSSVAAYYAIALNSTSLAGDVRVNFALSALADIPSTFYVLFSVDLLGRRVSLALSQLALCACCLGMAFAPPSAAGALLGLFLAGKFSSSCVMNVVWLYTAELYPTNLRVQAVGTCSLVARAFGMLAPFVEELVPVWRPLPFLVLGLPAGAAGVLALLLPETRDCGLPDTKNPTHEQQETAPNEPIVMENLVD